MQEDESRKWTPFRAPSVGGWWPRDEEQSFKVPQSLPLGGWVPNWVPFVNPLLSGELTEWAACSSCGGGGWLGFSGS